jgi:hypothetical protein
MSKSKTDSNISLGRVISETEFRHHLRLRTREDGFVRRDIPAVAKLRERKPM